jgi:hypothetical protein
MSVSDVVDPVPFFKHGKQGGGTRVDLNANSQLTMNTMRLRTLGNGIGMLQTIIIAPELLVAVMHEAIPLRATLGIERELIVMG